MVMQAFAALIDGYRGVTFGRHFGGRRVSHSIAAIRRLG